MTTNSWNFSIKQKEEAISYYQQFGVVGFHDGVMPAVHPRQNVSSMRGCHS